jgi:hypothetical protein
MRASGGATLRAMSNRLESRLLVALAVLALTSACLRGHGGGASTSPPTRMEQGASAPPPVAPEVAAAEPPQVRATPPRQEAPPEVEPNDSARSSRMERYLAAYRKGRKVLSTRATGCTELGAAPGCVALHACTVEVQGTSGNAFNETRRLVWIGPDAAAVRQATEQMRGLWMVDGVPGDGAEWPEVDPSRARLLTLKTVLTGMPGYGTMHGVKPPAPEVGRSCTLVEVDACARRIGYVCSGPEVEQEFAPQQPKDGLYAYETVFGHAPSTVVRVGDGELLETE